MRPIEFERQVCNELRGLAGLRAGDAVVAAVSGGADSVALLRAICERNRRDELGWRVHVGHLNHGLRGAESDADAEFVRKMARELGAGCTIRRARLGASPRGVEERARTARYRFLERVARDVGATVVAVAHHADDQAETVLHHVLRGTGLRGLGGMRAVRAIRRGRGVFVARPMLAVRRADVLDYLAARGQAFREDRMNADWGLMRNRIRGRVLPMVETEVSRNARKALCRLAVAAQWAQEFVDDASEAALEKIFQRGTPDRMELDASGFARLPRIVRVGVVVAALRRMGARLGRVRFEHLRGVADLAAATRNGKRVELPGQIVVRRTRGSIALERIAHRAELMRTNG